MWSDCETTWKQTMTTHVFAHFTLNSITRISMWLNSIEGTRPPQKGDKNRSKTKPQDAYLHLSSEKTEILNGVSVDEPNHWRDLWMRQQVDTQKVCWFNTSNGRANSNEWWQFEQRRGLLSLSKAKLCSNVIYVSHVVFPFTKPFDTVRHTCWLCLALCLRLFHILCNLRFAEAQTSFISSGKQICTKLQFQRRGKSNVCHHFIFIHRVA